MKLETDMGISNGPHVVSVVKGQPPVSPLPMMPKSYSKQNLVKPLTVGLLGEFLEDIHYIISLNASIPKNWIAAALLFPIMQIQLYL